MPWRQGTSEITTPRLRHSLTALQAVADVAEAIIGAAYISGGRDLALKVTKALNIPLPNVNRWSDFGRKALAPPPNVTSKLREGSLQAVEAIIGHKFSRPHLLAQALVRVMPRLSPTMLTLLRRPTPRLRATNRHPMNGLNSSAMLYWISVSLFSTCRTSALSSLTMFSGYPSHIRP